tara:strand:+ start:1160 stop:1627 length:468 start_codon:yes stop_codon:yes gene_type:complete
MALTYDITKVKNWKSTCYRVVGEKELEQEREWEKTNPKRIKIFNLNRFDEVEAETNEIVIYEMKALTMNLQFLMALNIGIGEITESNYQQVYARVLFQETLNGCNLVNDKKELFPTTLEDIKNHIGMKVNASLKQPAQFTRSVIKQWKSRLKLEL